MIYFHILEIDHTILNDFFPFQEIREWVAEYLSEKVNEEIKQKIQFYHEKGCLMLEM